MKADTPNFYPAGVHAARATAYYPPPPGGYKTEAEARMEGGPLDRRGKPLCTLQQYLAGKAPYVSVAMDTKAFPYGTILFIPEISAAYGKTVLFRVVDTGGAFKGQGTARLDICVANKTESHKKAVNGAVTLIPMQPMPTAQAA